MEERLNGQLPQAAPRGGRSEPRPPDLDPDPAPVAADEHGVREPRRVLGPSGPEGRAQREQAGPAERPAVRWARRPPAEDEGPESPPDVTGREDRDAGREPAGLLPAAADPPASLDVPEPLGAHQGRRAVAGPRLQEDHDPERELPSQPPDHKRRAGRRPEPGDVEGPSH